MTEPTTPAEAPKDQATLLYEELLHAATEKIRGNINPATILSDRIQHNAYPDALLIDAFKLAANMLFALPGMLDGNRKQYRSLQSAIRDAESGVNDEQTTFANSLNRQYQELSEKKNAIEAMAGIAGLHVIGRIKHMIIAENQQLLGFKALTAEARKQRD